VGIEQLDAQTSARLLRRALAIKGGPDKLAEALGVSPHELAPWLAGGALPPPQVLEKLPGLVLDDSGGKPRVLLADRPDGCVALAKILGDEFALVPVHTLTDGLDLLRGAAALPKPGFDAIVCGQHFEGSQMLRFLESVKAYQPASAIPFLCCRATPTSLGGTALAAMREACEALGAVAYIDLPERQQRAGAELAAVEFRDAVRAAVRLRAAPERLRILVVDDNADAAHTLSALLRMAGHDTYKAASGTEALALGAQIRPQAAVLDIGMQAMSGYALAQRMRAQPWGTALTLIAVTGHGAAQDVERARQAGFDHHFTKPVMLEQLLEVLPAGAGG
jgi:CheY-like chemotaxis protein